VITLEADGCGLYTTQALWTQAREALNVTTVICANRIYRIIRQELARAGVAAPGLRANALTDLSRPVIDWVEISRGFGVPAVRVDRAEDLVGELERALAEPGPHLIEAVM
jgi:acetolactate synthase-1/2/3 large subunit